MIPYIKRLSRFESPQKIDWLLYFCFFTVLHIPGIINFYHNDGMNNAYLKFSESLMNGHLSLPEMKSYDDMIAYKGSYYLPYPPFPSLFLLPFVAILGASHVNTVLLVLVLSCLNLFLIHRILIRLNISQAYIPWLIVGFFFGTGYWFALFTSHHVYSFAHIISITLQLLAINELFGKRRWTLVGLLIGLSFLTRQFTCIYMLFALGYMYHLHCEKIKIRWSDLAGLLLSFGSCVLIYLVYNYIRFGNPLDPGYAYILFNGVLEERVRQFGVFSPKYFLFNFYSFFLKGFNVEFEGKGLLHIKDVDLWGTSLLSASPFLLAGLKAYWSPRLRAFAWATIGIILLCTLFYHNNGFHQVNTVRFSLDFLPLLLILTALGAHRIPSWLFKGMVLYALVLNVTGFIIHYIYQ